MGSNANMLAFADELRREFPDATTSWDIRANPYMLIVDLQGVRVRSLIEAQELERGTEGYEKFKERVLEALRGIPPERLSSKQIFECGRCKSRTPLIKIPPRCNICGSAAGMVKSEELSSGSPLDN